MPNFICKHGKSLDKFCNLCGFSVKERYSHTGKHDLSPDDENVRDLVNELEAPIGRRLAHDV